MSGPIVRKYGFPNFDKIFGARDVPHGAPEEAKELEAEPAPKDAAESTGEGSPPGADATLGQKESEDSAQL